jgi:predicted NAD-dependent protein-ADP-ribosyltransferase YbiA (DUF1768 family)
LATGDRVLREHTGADKYWGDGGVKNTGKKQVGGFAYETQVIV